MSDSEKTSKFKVNAYDDRMDIARAFINSGYTVWIEEKCKDEFDRCPDKYICVKETK